MFCCSNVVPSEFAKRSINTRSNIALFFADRAT
jgi:hypothetical protein